MHDVPVHASRDLDPIVESSRNGSSARLRDHLCPWVQRYMQAGLNIFCMWTGLWYLGETRLEFFLSALEVVRNPILEEDLHVLYSCYTRINTGCSKLGLSKAGCAAFKSFSEVDK